MSVPKTATVVFDPNADTILVLPCPRGNTRFYVNSEVLCLASPVFRAMFGANRFKEGQMLAEARCSNSAPIEVAIAEDDPPALVTVLRILHFQYGWVPESITFDQLFLVAIICDKYDMRQALEVWLKKWLEQLITGDISGHKWLFIAYAFQRGDLFTKLSKELVINSSVGTDSKLLINGDFYNDYIPESVIDEIKARRQQAVRSILDCVCHTVEKYYTNTQPMRLFSSPRRCMLQEGACDSFHLGHLLRTFRERNVYPEASQVTSTKSIHDLQRLFEGELGYPRHIAFSAATAAGCNCTQASYCHHCSRIKSPILTQTNHAKTCSPLPKFQKEIKEIIEKIEGLEISHFIRAESKADCVGAPVGDKVWDYLQYE